MKLELLKSLCDLCFLRASVVMNTASMIRTPNYGWNHGDQARDDSTANGQESTRIQMVFWMEFLILRMEF